jgi:hypothetical protein
MAPVYEDCGLLDDPYFFCPARIVEPTVAAVVYTTGPVDVVLGVSNGLVITSEMPEVADRLYYSIFHIDQDGRLDDMVTIGAATPGIYTVGVVQEPDALPADIFSLTLVTPAQVTILAEDLQVQDIPSEPYAFRLGQQPAARDQSPGIRGRPGFAGTGNQEPVTFCALPFAF